MPATPAAKIYAHDPEAPPDSDFEPGTLAHLLAGNRGRLLDPRRTPITVTDVDAASGMFGVSVDAFEDAGARWQLPLEDIARFQFDKDAQLLGERAVGVLEQVVARLARTIEIAAGANARGETRRAIEAERARVRAELATHPQLAGIELREHVDSREGAEQAAAALHSLLDAAGLARLEARFATSYVSNPNSGEIVKGHSIVIAEMGLCPYSGPIVRDEQLFAGDGSRERRRAHLVLRLAFMRELMSMLGAASVELYRGIAGAGALAPERPASLIAATFSREVAMAHFQSPTDAAVLLRRRVPVARLFMTFLETDAMNARYHEAEAVLLGEGGNVAL